MKLIKPILVVMLGIATILTFTIDIFNIPVIASWIVLVAVFALGLSRKFIDSQIQLAFGFILCMDIGFSLCVDTNPLTRYCENYYQINIIDFFVAYYLSQIFSGKKIRYTNNRISIFLPIIYFLIILISGTQALNVKATLFYALSFIRLFIIYLYYTLFFESDRMGTCLIKGIAYGILFELLICVAQYIYGGPLGLSFIGEGSGFRARVVNGRLMTSIAGTFIHTSALAVYTLFAFSFVWFSKNRINKKLKYVTAVSCVIITLMTQSRTAMLIYVVLAGYYIITYIRTGLSRKKIIYVISGGILSILILGALYIRYSDVFLNSNLHEMYTTRAYHWYFGLQYILEKIFTGYGANNWADFMQNRYSSRFYTSDSWFFYQNPIHNVFLQIWFDLGFFGLLVYFSFYLKMIVGFFKRKYRSEMITICVAFSICAIIIGLFDWSMLSTKMQLCFWVVMGIYQNQIGRINSRRYIKDEIN